MYRIVKATPLPGFRLQLHFGDGVTGVVDLSDLVGQGVFSAWTQPGFFEQVSIDAMTGAVCWPGGIDLCPHSLHDEITTSSASSFTS
ncbi:MAG: DUF2442 domain-containing protein [Planctomycetota bacterium]